jgi:hypothetical protein
VRLGYVRRVGSRSLRTNVLRHSALGSEAVYRVLNTRGSIVEVEVITAPGLEEGTRLHLTTVAAAAMGLDTVDSVDRQHVRFGPTARDVRLIARGGREALTHLSRGIPAGALPTDRAG